jgi:hypothetical protein
MRRLLRGGRSKSKRQSDIQFGVPNDSIPDYDKLNFVDMHNMNNQFNILSS